MTLSRRLLVIYQIAAGLSDTSTGILLILAPSWTLRMMHVYVTPQPAALPGFIGTFVLAVGLSYFFVVPTSTSATEAAAWAMQWRVTATTRTLVAVFLATNVAAGHMEPAWLLVAASDGALAVLQWIGLARGLLTVAA